MRNTMGYDLRAEAWIPWRRRDLTIEWGPPSMLVSQADANPVVGVAWPRADFDAACQEFLIGLLTTALQPADEDEWTHRYHSMPGEEELRAKLAALPGAFTLDGSGPRFLQDFSTSEFADIEVKPIEQLLLDAAGDQGIRNNTDLFIKRARLERLGRPAAAMALITMQTYAPSGGQGHRTSLRGGGPLTTLAEPRVDEQNRSRAESLPFWRKLWANIETCEQWRGRATQPHALVTAFPWLAPTRTSEKDGGGAVTPDDVHPLHAYFGMPRRIRLDFAGPGICELTGRDDECCVTGFRMRNYGFQYDGWRHPLSPYYRTKLTEPPLPVHGQPGGLGWRDWMSLTLESPESGGLREPAASISVFARRAQALKSRAFRMHAFGYDFDNMKARGWIDAVMPVFAEASEAQRSRMRRTASRFVNATSIATTALAGAVKDAYFERPKDAPGDYSAVKQELWSATEEAFYGAMSVVVSASSTDDSAEALAEPFREALEKHALEIFDRWCSNTLLEPKSVRRLVGARHGLVGTLKGRSALGQKLAGALGKKQANLKPRATSTRARRTTS